MSFVCFSLLLFAAAFAIVFSEPFNMPPMTERNTKSTKIQRYYDKVDYYEYNDFAGFEADFLMTKVSGALF